MDPNPMIYVTNHKYLNIFTHKILFRITSLCSYKILLFPLSTHLSSILRYETKNKLLLLRLVFYTKPKYTASLLLMSYM